MQTYEITYIISPDISSVEAEEKVKNLEAQIQKEGGAIIKQIPPTAKTLSYRIGKHASGFVGTIEFQIESEKITEVLSFVKKDTKIVRHMVLVKKPVKIKKQRRTRKTEELPSIEAKEIKPVEPKSAPVIEKVEEKKVELKDIEQQLDEILGE